MILILISTNKLVISSELTAENEGASMPSLRNLNEGPPAMPQSFFIFAKTYTL